MHTRRKDIGNALHVRAFDCARIDVGLVKSKIDQPRGSVYNL